MDLDYPSQKRNELTHQLNHVDRRYGSVILSNPKIIISAKPICKKVKKKALILIYNDKHIKLIQLLEQQKVSLCDQISKQGHGWTILHYIAKNNSKKCMQVCLRWLYQTDSSSYEQTVNKKNCQGDTPILTACMYKSNSVVKTLLDYGGIDIYAMNSKKLTSYQVALSLVNEEALQMLMKYELKIKRKNVLNKQALKVPLPQYKTRPFQRLYDWFIDCLYFGDSSKQIQPLKETQTDRKMVKRQQNQQQIPNIEIIWLQPQKVFQKKLPLFSSISHPFSIKQSNIIVAHQLIIFQVLAEHPQMLKRIIYNAQDKFYVRFQGKNQQKLIWVDGLFPFFVQNNEPLFLSLQDQLWPMVLQKALSQYYRGYFQPAKIPISQLIQTITGNQSYTYSFRSLNQGQRAEKLNMLLKIQSKNCILILTPAQNSYLKAQQGRLQCFSLLKILNDKFLVNCPFIYAEVKKHEQKYTRQMKLHQAHYNNPSCTTIWLDTNQFFQIFASAIFCHTLNTSILESSSIKVTTEGRRIYLVVKIKQYSESDKIYINIKDKFGDSISPKKCVGWNLIGADKQVEKVNCQILGNIEISQIIMPSQVLLMCQFDENLDSSNISTVGVTCRCEQKTTLDALDCTFGDLQFMECCKKFFKENYDQYDAPIIQTIGNYVLAMATSTQPCYIPLPVSISEQNIVEGMYSKNEQKLQMFKLQNIYFAVLANVETQVIKNLKIISYETQNTHIINNSGTQDVSSYQIQSV